MTATYDGPTPFVPDYEYEAQGNRVSRMAYHQPIMRFLDLVPPKTKVRVRQMLEEVGVPEGQSVKATPEQRKMVLLRIEKTWPKIAAQVTGWPKDSTGRPSFASKMAEVHLAVSSPSQEAPYAPRRSAAPPTTTATGGPPTKGPAMAMLLTCYCGHGQTLKAETTHHTCPRCGAEWTISLRAQGRPAQQRVFSIGVSEPDGPLDDGIDFDDEPY
jgi:predicted RNA-binding Zn-ribbon protein involved in translation (DUF1610 family)